MMETRNTNETKQTIDTTVEPLSKNRELRKIIQSKKHQLGFIEEFKYKRKTEVELCENMIGTYAAMIKAEREDIEHRLTLAVDIIKKKGFVIYQDQVTELNQMIIDKSEDILDQITLMLQEGTMKIYERKKSWQEQTNMMIKNDLLDSSSKEVEEQRMHRWISERLNDIDEKAQLFKKSLRETLIQTIRLLDQKAIKEA